MYIIEFTDDARNQIKKLDVAYHVRIVLALERVRVNPIKHLKKLSYGDTYYVLSVDDYYVVIDIRDVTKTLMVVDISIDSDS